MPDNLTMREALEPFAAVARHIDAIPDIIDHLPDTTVAMAALVHSGPVITYGDLRRAEAALQSTPSEAGVREVMAVIEDKVYRPGGIDIGERAGAEELARAILVLSAPPEAVVRESGDLIEQAFREGWEAQRRVWVGPSAAGYPEDEDAAWEISEAREAALSTPIPSPKDGDVIVTQEDFDEAIEFLREEREENCFEWAEGVWNIYTKRLAKAFARHRTAHQPTLLPDDEALVERLDADARSYSEASRMAAEAKSARQTDRDDYADVPGLPRGYDWLKPEQTNSWKAARRITHLSTARAEVIEPEPWPAWATKLLEVLHEYIDFSGDDEIDLPETLREWLDGYKDELKREAALISPSDRGEQR